MEIRNKIRDSASARPATGLNWKAFESLLPESIFVSELINEIILQAVQIFLLMCSEESAVKNDVPMGEYFALKLPCFVSHFKGVSA